MILLRRAMLGVVALTAVTAVLAGLARLGVVLPGGAAHANAHGPLFVLGVFGTVIALERAVAYGAPWAYAAPASAAASAALLVANVPNAAALAVVAAVLLAVVNAAIVRRQREPFTWLMLAASVVLALGDLAWALGKPVFEVVPAWMTFFVLTIVAERIELSRLVRTPCWATRTILLLGVMLVVAAALGATRLFGLVLAAAGAWELRFDIARRTVKTGGLARYSATGVLVGAAWTTLAGVAMAIVGLPAAGPLYDAVVHAVMVGFVLSMVFAHAPMILPAVARVALPFSPLLYGPLGVLQLALAARIAGDVLGVAPLRVAGGVGNALAIVLFLGVVLTLRRGDRARARGAPAPSAAARRPARAR